jgi:lipid-A-disaccharide synthase-like uncharacterized protein
MKIRPVEAQLFHAERAAKSNVGAVLWKINIYGHRLLSTFVRFVVQNSLPEFVQAL